MFQFWSNTYLNHGPFEINKDTTSTVADLISNLVDVFLIISDYLNEEFYEKRMKTNAAGFASNYHELVRERQLNFKLNLTIVEVFHAAFMHAG